MLSRLDTVAARVLFGAASAFLVAVALVHASRANLLPDAPDQFTYDWRTVLFSEAQEDSRDDIAIVLIDEESLDGYPYSSPLDRGFLADLIREIDAARPKAIGLDFVFDSPTEPAKDEALLKAINSAASPIVLGAIDERAIGVRQKNFRFQEDFIKRSHRPAGHLFFLDQGNGITLPDQAVRFIDLQSSSTRYPEAFAKLLADLDGKKPELRSPYIAWLSPPARFASPIFQTFRTPSDRNEDGTQKKVPAPKPWLQLLSGKIVLVGGGFIDRDRHLTPFSVIDNARMPGVFIHAQILAQLRDGRSIFVFTFWQEVLLAMSVFGLGFLTAQRWSLGKDEWIASGIAFAFLIAASLGLFWACHLILPSSTLVLAWPTGLVIGNFYDRYLDRLGRRRVGDNLLHLSG